MSLMDSVVKWFTAALLREDTPRKYPLSDYERLSYELRPCDVILVEGRSRISEVIRVITQSPWSHSALYIGRLHDIENPIMQARVKDFYSGSHDAQLVIESMLGKGTIVTPLDHYKKDHLRICRPRGISKHDAQQVIGYAIGKLGTDYDVRQLIDLARFMFPYSFLPRRWRSTLFRHHAGKSTRAVCSSMLAEAFHAVKFPILPIINQNKSEGLQLFQRDPRLYTPRDFDYSPYFEIIKYPFVSFDERPSYRSLPWSSESPNTKDDAPTQQ